MKPQVGTSFTVETVVDQSNVASAVGSGLLEVFATPMMIAQMELAATSCMAGLLEEGQASVGTAISVEHSAATPTGMRVTTTATITAIEGRRVDFELTSSDEAGEIGKGSHTRFAVGIERFMAKAKAKLQ